MDKETDGHGSAEAKLPDQVAIDFIKSNSFRVIHVDGVWGGVMPPGTVQMALFSQRPVIPQQVSYKVTPMGTLGAEIPEERVSRRVLLIREVEVDAILNVDTAKELVVWLVQKIQTLDPGYKFEMPQEESR